MPVLVCVGVLVVVTACVLDCVGVCVFVGEADGGGGDRVRVGVCVFVLV